MLPHLLTNFELQKFYQNETRFNGVSSRNNLPKKIKDGSYVINFDEYADVGTHWTTLFCGRSEILYFNSLVLNMFLKKLKRFVGNKNIIANILQIEVNISIMCGYVCIGFINFKLVGRKLTGFTSIFSLYDFKKNDNIILSFLRMNEINKTNLSEQTKF